MISLSAAKIFSMSKSEKLYVLSQHLSLRKVKGTSNMFQLLIYSFWLCSSNTEWQHHFGGVTQLGYSRAVPALTVTALSPA